MTRLAHFSDLHYCGKFLDIVDLAFSFAIERAIERGAEVAIIAGDSFDAAVSLHEPAVDAFFRRVNHLTDSMAVAVLQGTYSHDRPGSLAPLRHVNGKYPIAVLDRICQAAWTGRDWVISGGWSFDSAPPSTKLLVSALPSINKGAVAAAVGAENAAEQAGEMIAALCRGWGVTNSAARLCGIPTVCVAHGTVNGAVTETARVMVSQDHEMSAGAMFAAEASAVLMGHIHRRQFWEHEGRQIAYPGSITKLIHGHQGETGALIWDVRADGADFEAVDTPSRRMIDLTYDGPPDMDEIAKIATQASGAYIRLRFSVDEEHRHSVDKNAIRQMFIDAGAEEVKVEGRINPVMRTRSAGISKAPSLADKLRTWADVARVQADPLTERLSALNAHEPDEIVAGIVRQPRSAGDGE